MKNKLTEVPDVLFKLICEFVSPANICLLINCKDTALRVVFTKPYTKKFRDPRKLDFTSMLMKERTALESYVGTDQVVGMLRVFERCEYSVVYSEKNAMNMGLFISLLPRYGQRFIALLGTIFNYCDGIVRETSSPRLMIKFLEALIEQAAACNANAERLYKLFRTRGLLPAQSILLGDDVLAMPAVLAVVLQHRILLARAPAVDHSDALIGYLRRLMKILPFHRRPGREPAVISVVWPNVPRKVVEFLLPYV